MGTLLILILTFLGTTFFGYWAHKSLHLKVFSRFSNSHNVHHNILYPITDFKSDTYRSAGKDSTVIFFAVASLPVLAMPVLLMALGVLSLIQAGLVIALMLFTGWAHDYVHELFHLNNPWLNKIPVVNTYFKKLEHLHYLHHVDETKNFGIYVFWWDRIFGTLKKND